MARSLKSRLLVTALSLMTLAWALTLGVGLYLTRQTLNAQLDSELQQMAEALSQEPRVVYRETVIVGHEKNVEFQIFQKDKMIAYSAHAPKESFFGDDGFSSGEADQRQWRVFSTHNDKARIAVGQDLSLRRRLIRTMLWSSLWPMAVALPLIALLLWFSVTLSLRPLQLLAREVHSRAAHRLAPILLSDVPTEVLPVVESINKLLFALSGALEREKHFTDDAAHELRTPLAGIKAQTEAALRATDAGERGLALGAIKQGVDRASRTVSQLLTLARLDPENPNLHFEPLDLSASAAQAVAQLAPSALLKKIDLGVTATAEGKILADPTALELLLSNLIENAIKYSPAGGRIDVWVEAQASALCLNIEDAGPGIAIEDRERVFERFVRADRTQLAEGSGIGLAIVKRIADLHHATIHLDNGRGLRVRVMFPKSEVL